MGACTTAGRRRFIPVGSLRWPRVQRASATAASGRPRKRPQGRRGAVRGCLASLSLGAATEPPSLHACGAHVPTQLSMSRLSLTPTRDRRLLAKGPRLASASRAAGAVITTQRGRCTPAALGRALVLPAELPRAPGKDQVAGFAGPVHASPRHRPHLPLVSLAASCD